MIKHKNFLNALYKTIELFREYIKMQNERLANLEGAQANTRFMSSAVTMVERNCKGIEISFCSSCISYYKRRYSPQGR